MNAFDTCFATLEQFSDGGFDIDDVLQLSPGPLDFTSTQVELPGIQLQWNRVGAKIRARESYRGSGVLFGFVLQSPSPLKSFGRDIDYGYAVVWHPGSQLEYVAPTGLASLIVHVDGALADLLGWMPAGSFWSQVPGSRLRNLERTCRLATQAARRQAHAGNDSQTTCGEVLYRDRILSDVEAALEPWMKQTPGVDNMDAGGSCFRLVKETEEALMSKDWGRSVPVDTVADALGVSRRTLFYAFRRYLGMGPHAYLQLVRLHELRKHLLSKLPSETTVGSLAYDLGFNHLGRLSAAYREHFGEYPSDTLRRE
jgi:AraC-like DNA-binding protein